jgi:hypothetical protein
MSVTVDRAKALARLESFRGYRDIRGQGGDADARSIDRAVSWLKGFATAGLVPTLEDDGTAVVEFDCGVFFASFEFREAGVVAYVRPMGGQSVLVDPPT